ncbi:hypothetical protein M378DRAFT_865933 [Amanita muscaria Koide BX008]|uniref:F-box domain-containing protein n=1 Tax=Amanita muscaria (strain Koide BX008) TaxID=946122 RepID=A0A0C2WI03_AMAMK|nr:hypothetical protein M378DRAFT_865933 [Amanita muscaria Koide BX008]
MNIARLYTSSIDEHSCISLDKISDSSNLPRELVECILLLLDVDSMLTCRLVNREFNEIIQSSTLFQDFLARQPCLEEFNRLNVGRVGFGHVDEFCISLSNLYKSVATSSIDRNRWKVTGMSILKSTRGNIVAHMSLVAEVVCGRVIVYLRLERKMHRSRLHHRTTLLIHATLLAQLLPETQMLPAA